MSADRFAFVEDGLLFWDGPWLVRDYGPSREFDASRTGEWSSVAVKSAGACPDRERACKL